MEVYMKKLSLAFTVALLISGLFISQVSAATSPSAMATGACGSTYTVVGGDNLTKIAARCGTTISDILYYNPSIVNANLIYVGQVLKLSGTTTNTGDGTTYSGNAYITVSATTAEPGDKIVVKAYNFPKNASIDFRVGKKGQTYKVVYDGTTDSSGYAKKTITIPSSASEGQTWVVKVLTTDRVKVVSITSSSIYINYDGGGGDEDYPDASVTLSKYSVSAGGNIVVYVNDFPDDEDIDYCVRKKDSSTCKVIYDGHTDSDGYDSITVTIPSGAASGSYWVVQVKTTNLKDTVLAVSSKITIK